MRRYIVSIASTVLVTGALALGATVTSAAETSETTTLATQTKQMDSLTSTRGETTVSGRISSDFSTFAGSTSNANALVSGLRNGTPITLTSTGANGVTTTTTFTPPTGKMGYGNVYISLALAKQQLAGMGITEPTAQQLQASLVGGTVTTSSGQTTTLQGVLQMRAQGMGWGQIAQSLGYKLGPVISGMKSANAQIASQTSKGGTSTTTATTGTPASTRSKSGIVTGAGGSGDTSGASGASAGQGHAYGRGIVTGAGTPAGSAGTGQGNAPGRGIVSGTGAGQAGAGSGGQGRGAGKGN